MKSQQKPGSMLLIVPRMQTLAATGKKTDLFTFEYGQRLRMKGFAGEIVAGNELVIGSFKVSWFVRQRLILQSLFVDVFGKNEKAGLLIGMLIGDTSLIPADRVQAMTDAGLVHILAVSGGNICLLAALVSGILFFIPWRPRHILLIGGIVLYGIVCGLEGSVLRAVGMAVLSYVGLLMGRTKSRWRMLGVVFFAMMFRNPYSLYTDVGFLLSFAAVIGIRIAQDFNKTRWFGWLYTSLGAGFGTWPVLLIWMGNVNGTGFLANLIVVPLVSLLTISGTLQVFLQKYFARDGGRVFLDALIQFLFFIADQTNRYSSIVIVDANWLKISLLVMFVLGILLYKKQ